MANNKSLSISHHHGTSEDQIDGIVHWLRRFKPHHLHFLLDLGRYWSKLDRNRMSSITSLFRETYGTNHTESDVRAVLNFFHDSRAPSMLHDVKITSLLFKQKSIFTIEPYSTQCSICSSILTSKNTVIRNVNLCWLTGEVTSGRLVTVVCTHARTRFNHLHPWSCSGNFSRVDGMEIYCRESIYYGSVLYMGGDFAFERSFVEAYSADLISHGVSWDKTADSMNLRARNLQLHQTNSMTRRTIANIVLKFKLVEFDLCSGHEKISVPAGMINFTHWTWSQYPRLLSAFVYLWSNHRSIIHPCSEKCSAAIIVDGHQKCRRRVCLDKSSSISTEDFVEPLIIGCCRSPRYKSFYCDLHSEDDHSNMEKILINMNRNRTERKKKTKIRFSRKSVYGNGLGATSCRTKKELSKSRIEHCARSFGIIATVTNCGIVTSFAELLRSETLREIVHLFLASIRISGTIPSVGCYDDGCRLVKYIHNNIGKRLNSTTALQALLNVKFSVDRTHFRNHVGKWCRANMDPNQNHGLIGINTQAAEQLFSWLKSYAPILSNMGYQRLHVFLLILFHMKNMERIGIPSSTQLNYCHLVPNVPNVSLHHAVDVGLQQRETKRHVNLEQTVNIIGAQEARTDPEVNLKRPGDDVKVTLIDWQSEVKQILASSNRRTERVKEKRR